MKRILLVEDTPTLANEIADLLRMEDYDTTIVRNGLEALKLLRHVQPDLIITDLLMPTMDGFELLHRIKSDNTMKNIPVIIITAKVGDDVDSKARELGIQKIIRKPCKATLLINSVSSILKQNG